MTGTPAAASTSVFSRARILIVSREDPPKELIDTVFWRNTVDRHHLLDVERAVDEVLLIRPDIVVFSEIEPDILIPVISSLRRDQSVHAMGIAVIGGDLEWQTQSELLAAGANLVSPMAATEDRWSRELAELVQVPPRFGVSLKLVGELWGGEKKGGRHFNGNTIDLSLGGAQLATEVPLRVGARTKITLDLPGTTDTLSIIASVVWSRRALGGGARSGLRFLLFRENDRERLTEAMGVMDGELELRGAVGQGTTEPWERELRAGEERRRAMFDSALDGIVAIDGQGRIVEVNPAAEELLGATNDRVAGRSVADFAPVSLRDELWSTLAELGQGESENQMRMETRLLRADGSELPIDLTLGSSSVGDRVLVTAWIRDVSARLALDRMKDELLLTVSHELSNPLASVTAALDLLMGDVGEDEAMRVRLLEVARSNSRRLVKIVGDILDVQRLQAGHLVLEKQPVAAAEILAKVVEDLRPLAQMMDLTLLVEDSGSEAFVIGDRRRLTQALSNLLSNAIQHSPEGQVVTVATFCSEGRVRFEIADRGPGVDPALGDKLYDRFSRGDSGLARVRGGLGLGLTISKALVELHGGFIGHESRRETGTRFFFELAEAVEH